MRLYIPNPTAPEMIQAHASRPARRGSARHIAVRLLLSLLLLFIGAPRLVAQEAALTTPEELPTLELSLREAIEMALRHNLDVQIASYGPDLQEEQIMASRARFDPQFQVALPQTYSRSVSQGTTLLAGADVLTSETVRGQFAFSHVLEWGTDWSLNWSAQRSASNNSFSQFNPNYNSSLNLNVSQPLLEGFGREVNTAQIITARNSYRQSLEQFRTQVQTIVFQTYQAYWDLVFSMRNLEVTREALELSRQQLERNQIQVEIGTLAPIETIQAESLVASRELSVLQQEVSLRDRMDTLKRLINVEASNSYGWDVMIEPTSEPPTEVPPIDISEALQVAMENDPELRQQRIGLESQQLNVKTARNSLLPQLNLNGSVQLSGTGGNRIFTQGFGSDAVLEIQEGGFSDALQAMLSGDFRNWSVGLTLSVPVNNWAARAQHASAVINERRTLAQIANTEQQLRVEVLQAARQVQSGVQQVAQARTATELAARTLDAEQRKFAVGSTTNFQVLEFQRQLSDAQTQELQAIIQLANAIARLEQAKGTLLESLGFQIGVAGVPSGAGSR